MVSTYHHRTKVREFLPGLSNRSAEARGIRKRMRALLEDLGVRSLDDLTRLEWERLRNISLAIHRADEVERLLATSHIEAGAAVVRESVMLRRHALNALEDLAHTLAAKTANAERRRQAIPADPLEGLVE